MIALPLVESNPLYWAVDQMIDQNTPNPLQGRAKSYLFTADDMLPGIAE